MTISADLMIIGGEGDLALRKLYPALYRLRQTGCLPDDLRIVGVARRQMAPDEFLATVETRLRSGRYGEHYNAADWAAFSQRLLYCAQDATAADGLQSLAETHFSDPARDLVVYLATPPHIFAPICSALEQAGLARPNTRIVVEKPLGEDRASFLAINRELTRIFTEDQVYRIDHYLGKEAVQNLLALRFANALLEPLWNNRHIDNVQITVAETIGVAGRRDFYDQAGAMRDMVQNHLLQLLCLTAMEPPARLHAGAVRDEKLKVLTCLRGMDDAAVQHNTVTGQYGAGAIDGQPVVGYREEDGGGGPSRTETFVALKIGIDNWRWAGVPFYLRTGKRLQHKYAEIVVEFKQVAHSIFGEQMPNAAPNRLVIRLQPEENIRLELLNKVAGLDAAVPLKAVSLNLAADSELAAAADAYQRLLLDVLRDNPTLFMRADEVEAAWVWVDRIIDAWQRLQLQPQPYPAGGWGPAQAVSLIARDGRDWHERH